MSDSWQLSERYLSPWGEIAYQRFGSGPPLVLVHGTPWSSFCWRHLIPTLASQYEVVVYNLLGYGESAKGAGLDVSLGVQNQVLGALLDHLAIRQPRIIGHDFGGTTVLRSRLLDGRRFARLILVDPVALAPWGSPFFRLVREHPQEFAGLPANLHEALISEYVAGAIHGRMPASARAGILAPWLGELGQAAFYAQIAQADEVFTDAFAQRFAKLVEPVQLIWGRNDTWVPLARAEALVAVLPNARLEVIEDAGHLIQEDQPAALLTRLLEALA